MPSLFESPTFLPFAFVTAAIVIVGAMVTTTPETNELPSTETAKVKVTVEPNSRYWPGAVGIVEVRGIRAR